MGLSTCGMIVFNSTHRFSKVPFGVELLLRSEDKLCISVHIIHLVVYNAMGLRVQALLLTHTHTHTHVFILCSDLLRVGS